MKAFLTLFLATILLSANVQAQIDVGGACETDSQCITFCCSNDYDYKVDGVCEEIEADSRCEARKQRDTVGLVLTLVALAVSIGVCAAVKVDQEKRKAIYLEELRIKGNSEAALEESHARAMNEN